MFLGKVGVKMVDVCIHEQWSQLNGQTSGL